MLRTALLKGNTISEDRDFSKYIESLATPGVIQGLDIQDGKLKSGKARIQVSRTGADSFYCYFENTEDLTIDTSGTKKLWIEIKQTAIDNGLLNNEDGSGIAVLSYGTDYPSVNFLKIASINNGSIVDEREYCKVFSDKYFFYKSITDLFDVILSNPTAGQSLVWDGEKFVNQSMVIDIAGLNNKDNIETECNIVVEKGGINYKSNVQATTAKFGLVKKATDEEALAGTEDSKYLTSKQAKTNYGININSIAGNVLVYGDSSETSLTSTTRIKVKEAKVRIGGIYTTRHDCRMASGSGSYTDTKVCVNGAIVGDVFRTNVGASSTCQRDVTVNADDLIQIYAQVYPTGTGYVSNFNIGIRKNEHFIY